MKKLIALTFTVLASAMLVLTLNNCNKVPVEKENPAIGNNNNTSSGSKTMVEHILAFKEKMEYYKDNPGLRSSEKEQVDSTVIDWESTINLTYCYSYLELSDTRVYDTTIVMPPINQDSMLMTDVSDKYYNEIVYAVQAQYFKAPFADSLKKLMVVDLEKTVGGDSLKIKSMIGNVLSMMHPPYDWKYGDYLGTCDGLHDVGTNDAAHVIADNTRSYFNEEQPPAGCRWYFYGPIQTILVDDPIQYPNPNDPDPVNYEDYQIYYASSAFGTITPDVLCLEYYGNNGGEGELDFYKQQYIDLTQGWINSSGGKKFKDCDYTGSEKMDENNNIIYSHKLITFLGNRGIICDVAIDNISIY